MPSHPPSPVRAAQRKARTLPKGQQTEAAIVDAALRMASQVGLEGLSIGALAEAKILGGQKIVTIAAEIETAFTFGQNWPLGSALATLLIGLTMLLVFGALKRVDLESLLGRRAEAKP